jgi:hypothetical protein
MAKKRKDKISMFVQENPFQYEDKEYKDWRSDDEKVRRKIRDSFLKVCGPLGKDSEHYHGNQIDQNYPEMRYAVHLV